MSDVLQNTGPAAVVADAVVNPYLGDVNTKHADKQCK